LADESRLAIVDQLTVGDASPSELASLTGLPSNLLAHHLGVLESHGLIARRRSDGDRRRSYVRLVDQELADFGVAPGIAASVGRVLFVCTANTARSQLAEALWHRASDIPVTSAGTHPAERVDPRAVDVATRHRLRIARRRPTHLDQTLRPDDLVVFVCDQAYEELRGGGETAAPRLHWSVPDPVRVDTARAFEQALSDIDSRVERLAAAATAAA
jgi:ArsR family transcriptional regulator, arsenate/arsenite/antimonite-responsive transcriptional repressor / arsenate reductase (thioredoxin)